MKHTWGKNNKTVKENWKQVWKMEKMAAETRRMFFWLSKTFSSRWLPLTGLGQIQRKTKNPVFITFFGLKDCGGFKGRREMSRYQVVPFAFFLCCFSWFLIANGWSRPYYKPNTWTRSMSKILKKLLPWFTLVAIALKPKTLWKRVRQKAPVLITGHLNFCKHSSNYQARTMILRYGRPLPLKIQSCQIVQTKRKWSTDELRSEFK